MTETLTPRKNGGWSTHPKFIPVGHKTSFRIDRNSVVYGTCFWLVSLTFLLGHKINPKRNDLRGIKKRTESKKQTMNDNTRTSLISKNSNNIFVCPTPLQRIPSPNDTINAVVIMKKKRHQDVQFLSNPRHSFAPILPQSRQSYEDSPINARYQCEADVSSSSTTPVLASMANENYQDGAGDVEDDFILTVPGSARDDFTSKPFLLPRFSRSRNHFDLAL
jgi:hypothetical protein